MATKSATYSLLTAILLLLLNVVPNTAHSKPNVNPFGFIKKLEGCMKGQNVQGMHQLKGYLARFGYLDNYLMSESDELFDESVEKAIRTYQLNYRLNVSGHLDAATVIQMMKPRCGFADITNGRNTMQKEDKTTSHKNRKSMYGTSLYAFEGTAWPSSEYHLTYQIQSETLVSRAKNMRAIVANALNTWAYYSPFTFEEVIEGSQSNLVFGFAQGDHGDGYRFDGTGGILAHSFYPTDGRSHYDAMEYWSDDPSSYEMDLNSVVLHEIGHLLGLDHSQDPTAVMHSGIYPGERRRQLQQDDIQGIQSIYGSN